MAKLRLSLACSNYDRTSALFDERIRPDGIDLTCMHLPVEETFFRMVRHREFDVAEMSLSSYVLSLFEPDPPFIAIPVFPSRMFRHSCIYIHRDHGIRAPNDLAGKCVGVPEYQLTACVWIRGILADEHNLPVDSVVYATGGLEEPGRPEKLSLQLPPAIRVEPIRADQTLASMLARGDIDALYTPRTPSTFKGGTGEVKRLFDDFAAVERDYFRRGGIFPIMHTLVIKRGVYDRDPWVAQSLYKAFCAAQRLAYEALAETAALSTMLPWLPAHLEDARREMGHDFWPYGLERNQAALSTFLRYSCEQGLAKQRLKPEQLFALESLESFKI